MAEYDDPANRDPDLSAGGEHGFIGKAVVSYNIVFDDEPQLKRFYALTRALKKRYPEERTIGGRLDKWLVETESQWSTSVDSPDKASKSA